MTDALAFMQSWYLSRCDGDWEHQYGIEVGTLDNPGWRVKVDLVGTPLADAQLERESVERTERDWLHVWLEGGAFHAACGPSNLDEALGRFRTFVEDASA